MDGNMEITDKERGAFLERRQKLSAQSYRAALENIASVLDKKRGDFFEGSDTVSLAELAFRIVAQKTCGLKIKGEPKKGLASSPAAFQTLAKDSNLRLREVLLRGAWFEEDNGHLLCFYKKNGPISADEFSGEIPEDGGVIPAALLSSTQYGGYFLINPEDGSKVPVDKNIAAQIYPRAFMLYRSMGGEKLSLLAILKFVFANIRRDIFRYVLLGILCALIGLLTPLITKHFIDHVIPDAARNRAMQICVLVFFCSLASMAASFAKFIAGIRMETRADSDLEAAVMDRLLKLPAVFFKNFSSGDLAARAMTIPQIRSQVFDTVITCFMNFIFSLVYLIQAFHFCPYFAKRGIFLCLIPIALSTIVCFVTYGWQKALVNAQGKIQGMLLQFLNGVDKISSSNSQKRAFAKWSGEYIRQIKIAYSIGMAGIAMAIISSVYPTVISIVFYYLYGRGLRLQTIDGLTTGSFMAFLTAFGSYQGAILALATALLGIRNIVPLAKRIKPILEAEPEIVESKPQVDRLDGNIEVKHLNFRYSPDSPLVLKDVNISVRKGDFVAIVGTSGSGKSTLVRALLGFEKPESGSIFYDGMDISTVDVGSLRRKMGVVIQNDTVMQGTILQNIVGSSGLKEKDAWEAAKKVSFDKDIQAMPMGMSTIIPAGGLSLSGGQLQRLIIARAIIKNPSVLIFDEATSSLDNITQMEVKKSLDALDVTRIIIAHRLSSVMNADKIYVLDGGRVVECGKYDELMQKDGPFARLAKRQNA